MPIILQSWPEQPLLSALRLSRQASLIAPTQGRFNNDNCHGT